MMTPVIRTMQALLAQVSWLAPELEMYFKVGPEIGFLTPQD